MSKPKNLKVFVESYICEIYSKQYSHKMVKYVRICILSTNEIIKLL
jgi:hypothetical protein